MKNSNVKFHIARPRCIFAAFVLASARARPRGAADATKRHCALGGGICTLSFGRYPG